MRKHSIIYQYVNKRKKIYEILQKKPIFVTARFHILIGPSSLFQRINFKLKDITILKGYSTHFIERLIERDAPIKSLIKFDIIN